MGESAVLSVSSDLGTGSQWNLETADVNAIMAQWSNPEPGCIDEQNAVLLAQSLREYDSARVRRLAELMSKFSPPITSSDAHKIVQNWKYYNGIARMHCHGMAPAAAAVAAASKSNFEQDRQRNRPSGRSRCDRTRALRRYVMEMSIPKAASTVYGAAKTRVGRVGTTLKRSTRKLRARL